MSSESDISDEILDERTESSVEELPPARKKYERRKNLNQSSKSFRLLEKSFFKTLQNSFANLRFKKQSLKYFDKDNVAYKSRINWCSKVQKLKDELKKKEKLRKCPKAELDKFVKCFDLESMRYVNISECYRYSLTCDLDASISYKFLNTIDKLRAAVSTGVLDIPKKNSNSNHTYYGYWNKITSNKSVSKAMMLTHTKRNPFVYLLKEFQIVDSDRKGYISQSDFVDINKKCGFEVFQDKVTIKCLLKGLESLQVLSELDKKLTANKKINYVNYLTLLFLKNRSIKQVRKRFSAALCMIRASINEQDCERFAQYFKGLFVKHKYYMKDLYIIFILKLGLPLSMEDLYCVIKTLNNDNVEKAYLRKIMVFDFLIDCDLCSSKRLSEACVSFKGLIPATKINLFIVRCEKAAINSKITVVKFQQLVRLMCTSYERIKWWRTRIKIPLVFIKNMFLVSGDPSLDMLKPLIEYMDQDRDNKLKVNLIKKLWKSKFDSVELINRNDADVSDGEDSEVSEQQSNASMDKFTDDETQFSLKDESSQGTNKIPCFLSEYEEIFLVKRCKQIYLKYLRQIRNARIYLPRYALKCSIIEFCSKDKFVLQRLLYNPTFLLLSSLKSYLQQIMKVKEATVDKLVQYFSKGKKIVLRELLIYLQELIMRHSFDIPLLLSNMSDFSYSQARLLRFRRAVRRNDFWFTGLMQETTFKEIIRQNFDNLESSTIKELVCGLKLSTFVSDSESSETLPSAVSDKMSSLVVSELLIKVFVTKSVVIEQEKQLIIYVKRMRNLLEDIGILEDQFTSMLNNSKSKNVSFEQIYSLLVEDLKLPFNFHMLGLFLRGLVILNKSSLEAGISRDIFVKALYQPTFTLSNEIFLNTWYKNIKQVDLRSVFTGVSGVSLNAISRQLASGVHKSSTALSSINKSLLKDRPLIDAIRIRLKTYNYAISVFGKEYKDLGKFSKEEINSEEDFCQYRRRVRTNSLFLSTRRLFHYMISDKKVNLQGVISSLLMSSSSGIVMLPLLRSELFSKSGIKWHYFRPTIICFADENQSVKLKDFSRYTKSLSQECIRDAVEQIRAKYKLFKKETGKTFFLKKGSEAKLSDNKLGKLLNFLGLRIKDENGVLNHGLLRKVIDAFDYDNNGYLNEQEIKELFLLNEKSQIAVQLEQRLRKSFAVITSRSPFFKSSYKQIIEHYSTAENKDFISQKRFFQLIYDLGIPLTPDDLSFVSSCLTVSKETELLSSAEILRFIVGRGKLKTNESHIRKVQREPLLSVPEQDFMIPQTEHQHQNPKRESLVHPLANLRQKLGPSLIPKTVPLIAEFHKIEKELILIQIKHFQNLLNMSSQTILSPKSINEKLNIIRYRENRYCSFICNVAAAFDISLNLDEARAIFRIPHNDESIIDWKHFYRFYMMFQNKAKKRLTKEIYKRLENDKVISKHTLCKYLVEKEALFSHNRFESHRANLNAIFSDIEYHLQVLKPCFCDENKIFDVKRFLSFTRKFNYSAGKHSLQVAKFMKQFVGGEIDKVDVIFNSLVIVSAALYLPDIRNYFSAYLLCHTSLNCWKPKLITGQLRRCQNKVIHCLYITIRYNFFKQGQLKVKSIEKMKITRKGSQAYVKVYLAKIYKNKIKEVISNTINIRSSRGALKGFSLMISAAQMENVKLVVETGDTFIFPKSTLLSHNKKSMDISTSICFLELAKVLTSLNLKRFNHNANQPLYFKNNESYYYLTKNLSCRKPCKNELDSKHIKNKLHCNFRCIDVNINKVEKISKLMSSTLTPTERILLKRMAHRLPYASYLITRDNFTAKDKLDEYLFGCASESEKVAFTEKYDTMKSDMEYLLQRRNLFKAVKNILKSPKHAQRQKIKNLVTIQYQKW